MPQGRTRSPPARLVYPTSHRWGEGGGWDVMIDPSMGNGLLIQTAREDGWLVRIGFDRNVDARYVTAFNEAWGDIKEGTKYPIVFQRDGDRPRWQQCGAWSGDRLSGRKRLTSAQARLNTFDLACVRGW